MALLAEKANLCLEFVSIPVKMNFHMTVWSLEMFPYSAAGSLYAGQQHYLDEQRGMGVHGFGCIHSFHLCHHWYSTHVLIRKAWRPPISLVLVNRWNHSVYLIVGYSVVDAFLVGVKKPKCARHYVHSHIYAHMPLLQFSLLPWFLVFVSRSCSTYLGHLSLFMVIYITS